MQNELTIVGSSINEDNLKQYYWVTGKNKQDQYLVAMQLLLENYCHFLCTNNAIGSIVYEHRELIGNEKLRDKYYHMKLMGSMYMTKEAAEKRLLGIDLLIRPIMKQDFKSQILFPIPLQETMPV